jgi:hypothetical protein
MEITFAGKFKPTLWILSYISTIKLHYVLEHQKVTQGEENMSSCKGNYRHIYFHYSFLLLQKRYLYIFINYYVFIMSMYWKCLICISGLTTLTRIELFLPEIEFGLSRMTRLRRSSMLINYFRSMSWFLIFNH